jgi:hypothetical protein
MSPEQAQKNTALVKKYEVIIWEGLDGVTPKDEIQSKVDRAIEQIEQTCREVLHAQHTLFGFLNAQLSSLWMSRK